MSLFLVTYIRKNSFELSNIHTPIHQQLVMRFLHRILLPNVRTPSNITIQHKVHTHHVTIRVTYSSLVFIQKIAFMFMANADALPGFLLF